MRVVLVCAADDRFAMPLTVTLASALSSLAVTTQLEIFILDGGISKKHAAKIEACLHHIRSDSVLHWVTPELESLKHLKATQYISVSTYLRLQIADLLPRRVSKAIYLDCDLIICKDLTELWTEPLDDFSFAAVRDFAFPVVSSNEAIDHWRELRLDPETPYFNAGVMLIDLDSWRNTATGSQVIRYLSEMRDRNNLADQGGLNAVLAGQLKILDPRWNATLSSLSLYEETMQGLPLQTVKSDPWIIHFTSRWKPWHIGLSVEAQTMFYYTRQYRNRFFDAFLQAGWHAPFHARIWVSLRKLVSFLTFALPRRIGLLRR